MALSLRRQEPRAFHPQDGLHELLVICFCFCTDVEKNRSTAGPPIWYYVEVAPGLFTGHASHSAAFLWISKQRLAFRLRHDKA